MSFLFLNPAFELIETNTGILFEHWILIIILVGSLIFAAKDFKLSLVVLFFLSGSVFVWFYQQGYLWTPVLIVFFMNLIILSFTLYAVSKSVEKGEVV